MDLNEPPAAAQPDAGPVTGPIAELDEWEVLIRVAGRGYTNQGFVLVNDRPYPSDLTGDNINVFVSTDGWWEFLQTSPEVSGRGAELPAGTVIVREVLDQRGEVETLTVMQRGPAGYSPAHGDMWYGVLEPDGFPRFEDGKPLLGRLEERCAGCHDGRAADGHLFGVRLDARRPDLPEPTGQDLPTREAPVAPIAPPAGVAGPDPAGATRP